ncbi:MAG TPA: hypothetical protein VKU82_10605 [Planctomycetaceae bacterium]|nr:hypothetical protein [Planctomycetaceae bacterium]
MTGYNPDMSEGRRKPIGRDLWRCALVLTIAGWWRALTFYGLVVVPEGTEQLGSQTQGLVTQQVTKTLNLVGIAVAGSLVIELRRWGSRWAWSAWAIFLGCQLVLFGVHVWLSDLLATGADRRWFYDVHRIYLFATAVQWGVAPYQLWQVLRRD